MQSNETSYCVQKYFFQGLDTKSICEVESKHKSTLNTLEQLETQLKSGDFDTKEKEDELFRNAMKSIMYLCGI